jgi:hypothetical protein
MLRIRHARVRLVEPDIFRRHFTPDCMSHACLCRDQDDRERLDACCQHGADLDLFERDAILARKAAIAAILGPAFRDTDRWFDASEAETDPDFPSGTAIRTGLADPHDEESGCVFLQHDARGCALHRAALESHFDPNEIKPAVCRLYPLAFGDGLLGLSDDFERYSCADAPGSPTVYRLMRPELGALFGADLLPLLDRAEAQVRRKQLAVVAHP